jgi:predicted DNA-binding transcriptional regulator YafY
MVLFLTSLAMNRIDRLFGILTFLQSKKFVPAEKIADKFKMSIRTVYRDIKALGEAGIPISFEQQKGYFVVQGYFLPPVSFTNEEANAFLLMETMVSAFADRSIQKHYTNGMNKVKAVLRSSQKEKIDSLSENIRLQISPSIRPDFEHLSIIQQAISTKTTLEIDYKNNLEEVSKRTAEPIGLVYYAFSWHMIAWCHLRKDYRDFKVARILKLRNTDSPFSKDDHIGLETYMKQLPVNY